MKQWSFAVSHRFWCSSSFVDALRSPSPVAAQTHGRLREPADVMFLAGHGVDARRHSPRRRQPEKQPGVVVEDVARAAPPTRLASSAEM